MRESALPASSSRQATITDPRMISKQRAVALTTVLTPAIGFAGGLVVLAITGMPAIYVGVWFAMHLLNVTGISVGFHRLATHRSFTCGWRTRRALLILGSMGAQGPVIHWCSNHRRHHHTCDDAGDVHSPHCDESGAPFESRLAGFWHAHVAWLLRSKPTNPVRYTLDLIRDSDTMFVNRHYLKWVALGILLPGLITFSVEHTLASFALGCLVGGLMRIFVSQHVTWSINSLTHLVGSKSFVNHDHSTNVAWLALLSGGESWHNNHHAFPWSARLGLRWWQLDPGWWILVALRTTRLAWDIKVPDSDAIASKRSTTATPR